MKLREVSERDLQRVVIAMFILGVVCLIAGVIFRVLHPPSPNLKIHGQVSEVDRELSSLRQ